MSKALVPRPARSFRRTRCPIVRLSLAGAVVAAALLPAAAGAAGPYEGHWQGASNGSMGAGCGTMTAAALAVQGDRVTGEDVISEGSVMPAGRFPIRGTIAEDGAFAGTVGAWDAKGKFSGDVFEGDYEFGSCTMLMRLTRAR
jgi:hypothetical protein